LIYIQLQLCSSRFNKWYRKPHNLWFWQN